MKKVIITVLLSFMDFLLLQSQVVYVDCNMGNDNNDGTEAAPVYSIRKAMEMISSRNNNFLNISINPGFYVLNEHITVTTEKDYTGKRIIIEATVLPGDSAWTPEKMPVILTSVSKEKAVSFGNRAAAFFIEANRVTIRGIKFSGYYYPNTYYFPIVRFDKEKTDLSVEQCMFVGDKQVSPIQVGVLAHGNQVKVDHCVFYNTNNGVVFWLKSDSLNKTGNCFTNNIVCGAHETAVWTSDPDDDLVFKQNIISNGMYGWIKNYYNETIYRMDSCVIVNNKHYQGVWYNEGIVPEEFKVNEHNITKTGEIFLQLIESLDEPIPVDFLHIPPNTLGYNLEAGLFKNNQGEKYEK